MGRLAGLLVITTGLLLASAPACLAAPPSEIVVQGALGGDILGYDVDQSGKEGILAEFLPLQDGKNDVAVETFDQSTGKILKIIREIKDTPDDFDAQPIVGNDVGLVLFQKLARNGRYRNIFETADPLKGSRFTGRWTPNFGSNGFLLEIAREQGQAETAILAGTDTGNAESYVFESDVSTNSFGRNVQLADPIFDFDVVPIMAFDGATNTAVIGSSYGCRTCSTEIALADLTNNTFSEFAGLGLGFVNGIAVDSADGIACTATEIDANVQFYDLASQTGFEVSMPNATSQEQSGQDVEYDAVNRLFLVGQPFSSTGSGSSVQVFDTSGNLVESIDNLSLPVNPAPIAINPNTRTAFVPRITGIELKEIQSFRY